MNNFELMTNANKDLVSLGIFFNQFAADTGRGRDKMDKRIIDFLIKAKQKTYAGKGAETASSREKSHDLVYRENNFMYYDTYLGVEKFAGEEALWIADNPYWSMNYIGRVTGENFNVDFLKEALLNVPFEKPFRVRKNMKMVVMSINVL